MDAFGAFEHEGWQKVATTYDDVFGELTAQCIQPLLDAADVRAGKSLLDVASGPGHLAGAAQERGAMVTGIDFSSAMVTEASRRYPRVVFCEGLAGRLPFADRSFDAVTIAFGLLHFPDPDKALAEAQRVLRPQGRVAFTVWAQADRAVGFGLVAGAVERLGNPAAGLPEGPPFFRFSDPGECRRTLTGLGFTDVKTTEIAQTWRFTSASAWIEGVARSTVRTAALLRAQSAEAMAAIRAALLEAALPYEAKDGAVELPMPAVLASARKP
ncbi:MAG TPA: methyltransferase domain-containing protein [Burkholderiales bacterium]|jgi:SAM-dependent methyltransferase|nr:methyltransferase domain-containing protein [Burkholderiales bacterium]